MPSHQFSASIDPSSLLIDLINWQPSPQQHQLFFLQRRPHLFAHPRPSHQSPLRFRQKMPVTGSVDTDLRAWNRNPMRTLGSMKSITKESMIAVGVIAT
jgi:hypothetical protein